MECPHGMIKAASCPICMYEGPVMPPTPDDTQVLKAERVMVALFDGRCARRRTHEILKGQTIGYVTDLGWCCHECAI